MNFKVYVTIFGTLLAVQASIPSPALRNDNIKEIVIELFTKGLEYAFGALEKANSAIDQIEGDSDEIEANIVAKTVEIANKFNALLLELIDELRDHATDEGKIVLDCIKAEQSKTDEVLNKTATDLGFCIAGKNVVVLPALREALSQIGEHFADVQVQVNTLSACSESELSCLLAFADSEIEILKKIPPVLTEDYYKLKELIQTIVNGGSVCAGDAIDGVKSSIQEIFNEAVICMIN